MPSCRSGTSRGQCPNGPSRSCGADARHSARRCASSHKQPGTRTARYRHRALTAEIRENPGRQKLNSIESINSKMIEIYITAKGFKSLSSASLVLALVFGFLFFYQVDINYRISLLEAAVREKYSSGETSKNEYIKSEGIKLENKRRKSPLIYFIFMTVFFCSQWYLLRLSIDMTSNLREEDNDAPKFTR